MPYRNLRELPKGVKNVLPKHAKEIYKEAYNSAWEEYKDPDDRRGGACQGPPPPLSRAAPRVGRSPAGS